MVYYFQQHWFFLRALNKEHFTKFLIVTASLALALASSLTTKTNASTTQINGSELNNTNKPLVTHFQAQEATYTAPEPKNATELPKTAQNNGSCRDWIAQAGVTDIENAYWLIMKESGCRVNARNASSGAYGIPQSLPASKIAHCGDDPICQIKWMQDYVNRRYGGWAGAVAHSNSRGWY